MACVCSTVCRRRRQDAQVDDPREKRTKADLVIVGIVYETWGIVLTNCIFLLYSIQHKIPYKHAANYAAWELVENTLVRITYSLCVEWLFASAGIIVLTLKTNTPINRVWRMKWKKMSSFLLLNAWFSILLTSKSMVRLTDSTYYNHLVERGDAELANSIRQCNSTLNGIQ